jgi:AraC family transcriptional regulator
MKLRVKETAPIETEQNKPHCGVPTAPKVIAGIGRVLLWSGGSLWIGRSAGRVLAHAHHAIQISLALSGRLRLRSADDGQWSCYAGAIVLPHQRHQFDGAGESVAQIFVEPETPQGRALLRRYTAAPINALPGETIEALVAPLRDAFAAGAANEVLITASQQLVTQLCASEQAAPRIDPRIGRAIAYLRARLGDPIALGEAAAVAHLSPSRFRHLFVEQTGMSLRTYLLWARVEAAVGAAMGGLSWTDAAHHCGFTDSAHLSRTCRRMFGLAPSMLIRE